MPAVDAEAFDAGGDESACRERAGRRRRSKRVRLVRIGADTVSLPKGWPTNARPSCACAIPSRPKALRHVFFAERAAAKVTGLEGVAPRPVETIGVVGTGLMGSGIAVAALDAGYRVIGVEQTEEAAAKGRERIAALLDRDVEIRPARRGRSRATARPAVGHGQDAEELADADLVIEAVFDDLAVKTELFPRLDGIVRPDAILATNTSYLDPDVIAAATSRPERVLGLHFFSPANVMRLVEVVRCARTGAGRAGDRHRGGASGSASCRLSPASAKASSATASFPPIAAKRSSWSRTARCRSEIDAAMEGYGFAMGPFAVFDLAGLEIAWARRKRQAATRDPAERYVDIADRLCEAGRFGQKTGRGWYAYPEGKRTVDPEVTALIEAARAAKGIAPRKIPSRRDRLPPARSRWRRRQENRSPKASPSAPATSTW